MWGRKECQVLSFRQRRRQLTAIQRRGFIKVRTRRVLSLTYMQGVHK